MVFWLLLTLLTVFAVALCIAPLLIGQRLEGTSEQDSQLAVLRDRRDEIEVDRLAGRLTDAQAEAAQSELVDTLAQSLTTDSAPGAGTTRRTGRNLPLAIAVALLVPIVAMGTYWLVGQPELGAYLAQNDPNRTPDRAEIEKMMQALETRTKQDPTDGQAWYALAQAYRLQGKLDVAAAAYEKSVALLPADAQMLADYADVLAQQNSGRLAGKPAELLQRAYAIDPENVRINALLGAVYVQAGDGKRALPLLRKFLLAIDPNSSQAAGIRDLIAKLEADNGATPGPTSNPQSSSSESHPGKISGRVTLAGELPPDGATLFIIARAADGPRIPYAVIRQAVGSFPLSFEISDANLMNPGRKLSSASDVVIEARISQSGQALRQAGDRYGTSAVIQPGADGLTIHIDQTVQ